MIIMDIYLTVFHAKHYFNVIDSSAMFKLTAVKSKAKAVELPKWLSVSKPNISDSVFEKLL